MHRLLLGSTALLLCACGSGNGSGSDAGPPVDFAVNFVGTWTGTFTIAAGMQQTSGTTSIDINEAMLNTITVVGCADNVSGPSATVTSATAFSLTSAYSCPPYDDPGVCSSIVLSYTSLSGSLTGTTLAFSGDITVAGCSVSVDGTIALTGGTKGSGGKM